jgi:PTS system nitrogen regulatory IIA component
MNLATLLPLKAVLPHLDARDKKHALKLLSAHAATLAPISDREIYSVLLEREKIGCTGMGNGVCIPHGRFEGLKTLHAIFARLDHPIEFGANDGRPVDLIFLLLTPISANTEHLKALATISRLLRDKALCESLRATTDAVAMHALLTAESTEDAA